MRIQNHGFVYSIFSPACVHGVACGYFTVFIFAFVRMMHGKCYFFTFIVLSRSIEHITMWKLHINEGKKMQRKTNTYRCNN